MTSSFARIPIRGRVTKKLDAQLYQIFPTASNALISQFRKEHMKFLWQVPQFTAEELRARGFSDSDINWIEAAAARAQVPLGMIVGANPLLAVPGSRATMPPQLNLAHHWVYEAAIWQLIGSGDSFSRLQIEKVLAPTPYRLGMSATDLFTSVAG